MDVLNLPSRASEDGERVLEGVTLRPLNTVGSS
jgi:hypothetical protein